MSEWAEILWGSTKSQNNKILKISAHLDNKQKSFVPKKNCGMLVFETLKNKISHFLNSNTCFCSQLYGTFIVWGVFRDVHTNYFQWLLTQIQIPVLATGPYLTLEEQLPHPDLGIFMLLNTHVGTMIFQVGQDVYSIIQRHQTLFKSELYAPWKLKLEHFLICREWKEWKELNLIQPYCCNVFAFWLFCAIKTLDLLKYQMTTFSDFYILCWFSLMLVQGLLNCFKGSVGNPTKYDFSPFYASHIVLNWKWMSKNQSSSNSTSQGC